MLRIAKVLDVHALGAIREALADRSLFEDGKLTAGWAAKAVKSNLQMQESKLERGLVAQIEHALMAHPVFVAAARPRNFIRTRISRYEPGMGYGWHTDDAVIEAARTDLAFTLFLSEPETYEGGELEIDESSGISEIKLPAGHAILYAATTIHRVAEIRAGYRLAAFGWVRSLVRSQDRREILFDLDLAIHSVFEREGKSETFDRLSKTKSNLLRLWAED